jgi:hypothetical protein
MRAGLRNRWQWLEARRLVGGHGATPYCPLYGVRHDITVHSLTMMLCEALFGGDPAAATDPRMALREDGGAVDPAAFIEALKEEPARMAFFRENDELDNLIFSDDHVGLQAVRITHLCLPPQGCPYHPHSHGRHPHWRVSDTHTRQATAATDFRAAITTGLGVLSGLGVAMKGH